MQAEFYLCSYLSSSTAGLQGRHLLGLGHGAGSCGGAGGGGCGFGDGERDDLRAAKQSRGLSQELRYLELSV